LTLLFRVNQSRDVKTSDLKSPVAFHAVQCLRETIAVAQRILLELFRRRRSLIFWVIFPVTVLIINGLIFSERTDLTQAEAFAQAVSPSLVGAALFFSCLGGSVSTVVAEREQQTLKRLFLSPLKGLSYFLGILLTHTVIGLGQTLLVVTIALFAGATFSGSLFLAGSIVFLSIVTYVGIGFILGGQFARRTEDVNALVAAFGVPFLLLGGAFLPTSLFPDSLLRLAKYNPVYHMTEALTAVTTQGEGLGEIRNHFLFLLAFSVVVLFGGWSVYNRMIQSERRF
jgi:ABC-2 type transport system permease protein